MEYPTTREQHAAVLEAVPDPLVLIDYENDEIIDVNAAAEQLLGQDREALIDGPFATLFPDSEADEVREILTRAASATEDPVEADVTVATDDEPVPVTVAARAVDLADRTVLMARLSETTALRERESRLRRYTSYLTQYHTITTDPEASFETKLEELLDLLCTHFDFDVALLVRIEDGQCQLMGVYAPGLPLFPGDTMAAEGTAALLASGDDEPHRITNTREVDVSFLLDEFGATTGSFVGLPVDVDDGTSDVLCLYDRDVRDDILSDPELTLGEFVVEWISYELTRRRRQRQLERQNDRLAEFASIVSHDLRNPLSAAKGYLSLAIEEGDEADLEKADRALDRMDALISEVLTLAREGETVGEPESVDLATAVERTWGSVSATHGSLEVADDLGTVIADEGRLEALLENLFRNAIQHAGPEVTVHVGPIEQGFYVADDGPGIDEDLATVMEYGYTTSEEGTGFGLAIVRQIAEAHDWTMRLEESETGGARFEFTTTTM